MSKDTKNIKDASTRIGALQLSERDAHSRVAVLFVAAEPTEWTKIILVAVSVKWLLHHGVPHNENGQPMAYHGTHIIQ